MGLYIYTVDAKKYFVYVRNHDKTQPYKSLCFALLHFLTESQLQNIINVNYKGENIVFFHDLIDCFRYVNETEGDIEDCICGKKHIENQFIIRNIETLEEFIVGSTCVENWCIKKINPNACEFCRRLNKLGVNCKNCGKMKWIRFHMANWLEQARDNLRLKKKKIDFGKFKGQSYYNVCKNEIHNKWWIDFVLGPQCKTLYKNKKILQEALQLSRKEQKRISDFDISRQMARLVL